jgi:hypothetical protein
MWPFAGEKLRGLPHVQADVWFDRRAGPKEADAAGRARSASWNETALAGLPSASALVGRDVRGEVESVHEG